MISIGGLGLCQPVKLGNIPSLCGIFMYGDDTSILMRMALCGT